MLQLAEGEEQLLTTIRLLELRPRSWETGEKIAPTKENILKRRTLYFGVKRENWELLFQKLTQKGFLQQKDHNYSLTALGRPFAEQGQKNWFIRGYDALLIRSERSKAHSLFCEQVYGKDLCQTGMTDMKQLEKLLEILDLSSVSQVLDLGCGIGKITEYLSDSTDVCFQGVDIAPKAIQRAQERTSQKKNRLEFHLGDINNLSQALIRSASLDALIALDSIYFADDLEDVILQMQRLLKPSRQTSRQMAIFYSQLCYPNDSLDLLQPDKTDLAIALRNHELGFEVCDLTASECEIRQRQMQAAEDLAAEFTIEGNSDILQVRKSEAEWALETFKAGRGRRYLYQVQIHKLSLK
jgi:SAM-dependent methyltransferase